MASKAIDFLESHKSETPSQFMEDVKWRKENESWLRWSRQLATTLMGYMQEHKMKRADLAHNGAEFCKLSKFPSICLRP